MELNNTYSNFYVKEKKYLQEVDSTGYVLEHKKTGAKLVYLENKDDNKVFSISFRTPPFDDSGIAHILEHSVLCGSRKYPLKEPFVELIKGSLNTFLNAMTFPDKTMYPIASRNNKDFRNLMDVYLDSVFYPNIYNNKYIMEQEGWHYEILDKNNPLEFKGVVYNEMKGVYSSPDAILENEKMKALFPDTPYSHESGGHPDFIPTLTQEKFEKFHKEYYHPSNSYIFLYGDLDIEDTLAYINKEYLSNFEKIDIDSKIKMQDMFLRTKKVNAFYPIKTGDSTEGKNFFSWDVVVGDALNVEQNFAFELLEHYLLETSASPLKKALIDKDIAKDVSGSFTKCLRQPIFSVLASGAKKEYLDSFISVIYSTLQKITMEGIDKELLRASLNRMEFALRESDFGSYPKGLIYAINSMNSWLYDGDPFIYLCYDKIIASLREKIEGRYYESLIENYLLDNTHRVVVSLEPKENLQEENEEKTKNKLQKIKESLNKNEIEEYISKTKDLLKFQQESDTTEALKTIPLLSRNDIDKNAENIEYEISQQQGTDFLYLPKFTNQIAYINIHFDASTIPERLVPYSYLLKDILGRVDTQNYTYMELAKHINMSTGGISFNLKPFSNIDNTDLYTPKFIVYSKVLVRNIKEYSNIVKEIMTNSLFIDQKRLNEVVKELKTIWDAEFFARGQNIAITRLLSYFSETGKYLDQGLFGYYQFLSELLNSDMNEIQKNLEEAYKMIFQKNNLFISYCCDESDKAIVYNEISQITRALTNISNDNNIYTFYNENKNEGIVASSQVQYVVAGGNFKKHGHKYNGAMRVLENIMRFDYLWNKIRVQGGAYGANARFEYNGNAFFSSYRDPNLKNTIDIYQGIPEYIDSFSPDERELTKYVIGTISGLDTPLTPSMELDKAVDLHLRNLSHNFLQKERDEIINCTVSDIKNLKKMLVDLLSDNYICVLGNEGKIRSEENLFDKIVSVN